MINYAESDAESDNVSEEDIPLRSRKDRKSSSKRRRLAVEDDSDDFVDDQAAAPVDEGTNQHIGLNVRTTNLTQFYT